jgi:general L-amino acid transport system permease protein
MQSPPTLAPAKARLSPQAWLHKNLFSTWYNSLLTLFVFSILSRVLFGFATWAKTQAQWDVIPKNLPLLLVGLYPGDQRWRIWLILSIIALLSGLSWGIVGRNARIWTKRVLVGIGVAGMEAVLMPVALPSKVWLLGAIALVIAGTAIGQIAGRRLPSLGQGLSFSWFVAFFISLWLLGGGLGLQSVSTSNWGGLTLTLLTAVVSIVLCFPIGVLLALGRRSTLPVIRWLCTIYIEVIRGVPLISILFMGQVLIPMFLPEGVRPDRVLRAIIGLTLFSAAYLAENVRGGLQAIPRGQTEAAQALGLNTPLTLGLIVLPQALKISIPAIVGQFISLFQDTTLLSVVGLVELLGISNSVLANPLFLGRYSEVYLFNGVLFWFFCYSMSIGARRLERQLN